MDWRRRFSRAADGAHSAALGGLLLVGVAGFGGVVWWFPPVAVALVLAMLAARLVLDLVQGRMLLIKSPLLALGFLGLALGAFHLVPLPGSLARRASPEAHEIYATGTWPRMVQNDQGPGAPALEAAIVRSPVTLDRAATLRWLLGAAVCLGTFWCVSRFVDRVGRLYLICGCVTAGFLLNVALGAVQLGGGAEGLWGFIVPGSAPAWGPTRDDLLGPTASFALRPLGRLVGGDQGAVPMAALAPSHLSLFGTMMGGAGAVLALGSMALPLALALALHLLAPRGSREGLGERLGRSGLGGLVALLASLVLAGAFLVGMAAGPWPCLPFAAALLVVGLPAIASPASAGPGSRWPALVLTFSTLGLLGLGAAMGTAWPDLLGEGPPAQPVAASAAVRAWTEGLPIARLFPAFGAGLGTFDMVHAYFRTGDGSAGFAASSLLRFLVEAGGAGACLLFLAALWSLGRLPACLKKVGSADRSLAHGLIGAALGFILWSGFQATVELPAVALSASALAGAWDRWLAGGTDLFAERG